MFLNGGHGRFGLHGNLWANYIICNIFFKKYDGKWYQLQRWNQLVRGHTRDDNLQTTQLKVIGSPPILIQVLRLRVVLFEGEFEILRVALPLGIADQEGWQIHPEEILGVLHGKSELWWFGGALRGNKRKQSIS